MGTNTDREVIVEFVGTTTETVKKKIRFEEDVDFENPSEDLKDLLFKEFLSQSYQKMSMRILHDEDLSDYSFKEVRYSDGVKKEPVDDNLVYMSEIDEYGEKRRNIQVCKGGHLISWGIKSILTVGKISIDKYFDTLPTYFSKYDSCDNDFWFNKDKEEIHDMWKNKEFKSMVESTREFYPSVYPEWTEKQFRKYHKLFEKGISTKKQREEGGLIIGILNDVDDYRKEYCTQENSILIGKILLDK